MGDRLSDLIKNPVEGAVTEVKNIARRVTGRNGIQNFAFRATGGDPAAKLVAGLALGVTGVGVATGIKGSKALFNSIKKMVAPPNARQVKEELEITGNDKIQESLDDNKSTLDRIQDRFEELISINTEIRESMQSFVTGQKFDRIDADRAEQMRIESEREHNREFLDRLSEMSKGIKIENGDKNDKKGIFKQFRFGDPRNLLAFFSRGAFARILTGGFTKAFASGAILKTAMSKTVMGLGRVLSVQLPKLLLKGITKFLGIGVIIEGAAEAIKAVFSGWSRDKSLWKNIKDALFNGIFGAVAGAADFLASFIGVNIDTKMVIDKARKVSDSFWGMLRAAIPYVSKVIVPSIKKWADDVKNNVISPMLQKIGDGFKNIFEFIYNGIRQWIIGRIEKVFGKKIGTFLSYSIKNDEEKAIADPTRRKNALNREMKKIEGQRESVKDISPFMLKKIGVKNADEWKKEKMAELDRREIRLARNISEYNTALKGKMVPSDFSGYRTSELAKKTIMSQHREVRPIVNVQPIVSNSVQNTSDTTSVISPIAMRNQERTIDRIQRRQY